LEGHPPTWVSWQSADCYLPKEFFDPKSSSSLPAFTQWIETDPITADDGKFASFDQVELVTLGCGLAFRALWIAQFPDRYSDVPAHIIDSPYPFLTYEQLSHMIQDLIAGYVESSVLFPLTICLLSNYVHRIEEIKAHNAQQAQSSKQGTSTDVVGNTEDSGETGNAVRDNGAAVGSDMAPEGNGVNGEDGAPRDKGKKKADNIGHKR
jgi:hypothetical protein